MVETAPSFHQVLMVSVTQKRTTAVHFSLLETGSHSPCWRWCDVNPTHPPKSWDRSTGHQLCVVLASSSGHLWSCFHFVLTDSLERIFESLSRCSTAGSATDVPLVSNPAFCWTEGHQATTAREGCPKAPDFAVCSLPFDSQGLCWLRRRLLPVFSLQILQRALLSLTNTLMPPTVWVCLRKNDVISWRTNPAGPVPGPVSFGSELLAYCSTFPFQLCVCRHALCLPCWLVMIFFSASFYLIPFGVNPP